MNYAFRMKLKPDTVEEYKRRHDEIWPELAQLLREAGIYDYSIFLDEEDMHLFAVLKLKETNMRELLPSHQRRITGWPAHGMAAHPDVPSRLILSVS